MTARDLPPSVPVTALRVFEPLDAFPAAQQEVYAVLAADPEAARRTEEAERRAAWRRVLGRPELALGRPELADGQPPDVAAARILRVEGAVLACPMPRPAELGAAVVVVWPGADRGPEAVPSAGGSEAPSGARQPVRRHCLVRAWELPPAWLAVVRAEDLTRSGGPGRYVLPMARARARAARALRTLRTTLGGADVTLDTEALARWLEQFHPRSWVELDTRPVAALIGGDDGADDVRLGLESLTVGDASGVAAAYRRMRKRSHCLRQLSVSS